MTVFQAYLLTALLAQNYLKGFDDVPTGMTDVKQPGGSLTAAVGDGQVDDTSAIQAIVNHVAGSDNNKVFFPRGEYLVSRNIAIRGSVKLHGTQSGIAVIKASTPYAKKIHNAKPVKHVSLKYLYFDGIRVEFDGATKGPSSTSNITIESCVFFSSGSAIPGDGKRRQLVMMNLENSGVYKNVFLRDSGAYGVASRYASTLGVEVTGNVCGLDLNSLDWLSSQIEPVNHWRTQKKKLQFLKTHYNLESDQGFFKSCLYSQCDKRMKIAKNILKGSPNTSQHRDHAMYFKGFDTLEVNNNYVSGWPSNPSGGIKARNGKNLRVVRNYLDDTSILLFTYRKAKACLHDGLKNVTVYGNHIVQRTRLGGPKSGVGYYEPHYAGKDVNIKYSANVFEIVGVSNLSLFACIWLTNGNLSQHHVYRDNIYYGTTMLVTIEARNRIATYETGDIDQEIKDLYNYTAYKLNIPHYQPTTPEHQHPYSPILFHHSLYFSGKENLFNNQELVKLVIISFLLVTLMCDSGVIF